MSLSLEMASQLVRSPSRRSKKSQEEHVYHEEEEEFGMHFHEIDEQECSPTRIMDFPVVSSSDDMIPRQLLQELSITPALEEEQQPPPRQAEQQISPLHSKQKRHKFKKLPALFESNHENEIIPGAWSISTSPHKRSLFLETKLPKPKPKNPAKVTRLERIVELCASATQASATGDEVEAVHLYRRAYQIADTEAHRLRSQLARSMHFHPSAVRSIQQRLQEDWLEASSHAGTIQLELTALYERDGEYEAAMEACREAKKIYKKQKKLGRNNKNRSINNPTKEPDSPSSNEEEDDGCFPWLVPCPHADRHLKVATRLLSRLQSSHESYTERKKNLEDILLLRQECLATTTDVRKRAKLFKLAEARGRKALREEQAALGKSHPQVSDLLHIMSALALDQNKKELGVQYLLQSYDLHHRALGDQHPRTGHDLLLLARAIDDHRSATYYEQAAAVFRCAKCGGRVVGSILNDLAVIHVSRQNFDKALSLLEEALVYFKDYADSGSELVSDTSLPSAAEVANIDAVQVWRNMGECYTNLKNPAKAAECFTTALERQRRARCRHDVDPEYSVSDLDSSAADERSYWNHLMQMINDESIADTLRRLGRALSSAGKFKEALAVYEEATQIHRAALGDARVLAQSGMITKLASKQDQLAATLYNVGELKDSMAAYDEAILIFNEAMQLRIESDGQRPESQRCNMVHCAMCLVGVANVRFKQSQFVESHKLYNNALFFCEAQGIPYSNPLVKMIETRRKDAERRVAEDPNRDDELVRLEQRAAMQLKKKQFDNAIRTLGEALAIHQATFEKQKKTGSDTSYESSAIIRLLNSCSKVFLAKGDKENAQRARRDALQLRRQVAPVAKAAS